jgi:hypothetical protein
MGVSTSAGTKIYIGTTASDPTTDTYVEIGSVQSLPEFGRVYGEANFTSLGDRNVQKFKTSRNDGNVALVLGKDGADAGQIAVAAALDVDSDYNFKVALNDSVAIQSATVSMTIAAPGVITHTAHGLLAGSAVKFSTTGALPTGLTAGTTYYVKTVLTADTYTVSATPGGAAIATTGTQSGVHTVTTIPAGTTFTFKAKVMSKTTNVGNSEQVTTSTVNLGIKSGSIVETPHNP